MGKRNRRDMENGGDDNDEGSEEMYWLLENPQKAECDMHSTHLVFYLQNLYITQPSVPALSGKHLRDGKY